MTRILIFNPAMSAIKASITKYHMYVYMYVIKF